MATSKCIDLDLDDKVKTLRECEVCGFTQKSVALKYRVSKSQVSRLVELKDKFFD